MSTALAASPVAPGDTHFQSNESQNSRATTQTASSWSVVGRGRRVRHQALLNEFLQDDWTASSIPTVDDQQSTWQEEAHWMSFRHAIHDFCKYNPVRPKRDPNLSDDDLADLSVPSSSSLMKGDMPPDNSSLSSTEENSASSLLASELAKARVMLALAEAEQDELEFTMGTAAS